MKMLLTLKHTLTLEALRGAWTSSASHATVRAAMEAAHEASMCSMESNHQHETEVAATTFADQITAVKTEAEATHSAALAAMQAQHDAAMSAVVGSHQVASEAAAAAHVDRMEALLVATTAEHAAAWLEEESDLQASPPND